MYNTQTPHTHKMSNALNNHHKNLIFALITSIVIPFILDTFTPIFSYTEYYEQDNRFSYFMKKHAFPPSTILILVFNIVVCSIYANIHYLLNHSISKPSYFVQIMSLSIINMMLITFVLGIQFNYRSEKPRPTFFHYCDYQGFKHGVESGDFSEYFELTSRLKLIDVTNCRDQYLDMYEFLPQNVMYVSSVFVMGFIVMDNIDTNTCISLYKILINIFILGFGIGIIYFGYSNAEYDVFDIGRGLCVGVGLGLGIGFQTVKAYKKCIEEKCPDDCSV